MEVSLEGPIESGGRRSRTRRPSLYCFLGTLALVACGAKAAHPPALAAGGEDTVQAVHLGPPDTVVVAIYDVARSQDLVWAAARGKYGLVAYDTLGEFHGGYLTRGDGPDQAGPIFSVASDGERGAVVWDAWRGRVLRVHPDGASQVLREGDAWRQPFLGRVVDLTGGIPNQIAAFPNNVLVIESISGGLERSADFNKGALVVDAPSGRRVLWSFASTAAWLDSLGPGRPEFRPVALWAPCGAEGVAIYDPQTSSVKRLRLDGSVDEEWPALSQLPKLDVGTVRLLGFRKIRAGVPQRMLSDSAIRAHFTGASDAALMEASSPVGPAYLQLKCSPTGAILLRRLDLSQQTSGAFASWEVYLAGQQPRVIWLSKAWAIAAPGLKSLTGVLTDSLDVARIGYAEWPAIK